MIVVDLKSTKAAALIQTLKAGQVFECETVLGNDKKQFSGYFSKPPQGNGNGKFWMAWQSDGGFRLTQDDARELIAAAKGDKVAVLRSLADNILDWDDVQYAVLPCGWNVDWYQGVMRLQNPCFGSITERDFDQAKQHIFPEYKQKSGRDIRAMG